MALPLASNGLTVHGIDACEATIKRLQAKPGGESVSVTVGDFANVDVAGRAASGIHISTYTKQS